MFPRYINRNKIYLSFCVLATIALTNLIGAEDYKILRIQNSPIVAWPTEMPAKKSLATYKPGQSFNNLRENAIRAYTHYWNLQGSYPVAGTKGRALVRSIITALPKRLKIQKISEKIAIVEVPWHRAESLAEKASVDDISQSGDIWILENDTWLPIFGQYIPYRKAQRVDLNGDGFEDIIVTGGCCDTISMNIFINMNNTSLTYSQNLTIIGNADLKMVPNCLATITVSHFQDEKNRKTAKFDCSTNRFQP